MKKIILPSPIPKAASQIKGHSAQGFYQHMKRIINKQNRIAVKRALRQGKWEKAYCHHKILEAWDFD